MNRRAEFRTGVAALRPWPFGPPLRGRAPRSDAGPRVALGPPPGSRRADPAARPPRAQATAPAGGLAWIHPPCYVQ